MKKYLLSLLMVAALASCHKDEYSPGALSGFNTSGAKALFIEKVTRKLYKITNDGLVQEVKMTDGSGKEYAKTTEDLINLHDGNVMIVFGNDDAYLVKVADGSSYGFSQHIPLNRSYEIGPNEEIINKFNNSYLYISNP